MPQFLAWSRYLITIPDGIQPAVVKLLVVQCQSGGMHAMKYIKKKVVLHYLYEQLTGNFLGFLIGMSATGLVSRFFETRSIRNLWGLASRKTVIDKDTFANLEWIISIVIGFVVFEVMTKVVKDRMDQHLPALKRKIYRFLVANQLHHFLRRYYENFRSRGAYVVSAMNLGMRHAINKYGKR